MVVGKHRAVAFSVCCIFLQFVPLQAEVPMVERFTSVARSLVVVEYSIRNELGSHELIGQGILLNRDGVILVAGDLFNEGFPTAWYQDIKIREPGRQSVAIPATFLGRTRDRLFGYVKASEPLDSVPFEPGDAAVSCVGRSVFSVAYLDRSANYALTVRKSDIQTVFDLDHTVIQTGGLTRSNSPVYDAETGDFIGITLSVTHLPSFLRSGRSPEPVESEPSSCFFPFDEVKSALANVPSEPFYLPRAWLGIGEISGLDEDVRTIKQIRQPAAISIGTVIPDDVAEKSGLKGGDIILTVDGQQFSTASLPQFMVMHFTRVINSHKPGDNIVLGILRDEKRIDIPVTLGASPKLPSEMPHIFSPELGLITRDVVFADTYARKLPRETHGVVVAAIKNGAIAALGATPIKSGYLITKVNDQPIEDQTQFLDITKAALTVPGAREMFFVAIDAAGETKICRVDLAK